MAKTPAQKIAILKRLRSGHKLTPLDALNDPEIRSMKLATRIGEIKRTMLGPNESILDSWVSLDNGKKIKQYFLVKVGQLDLL